MTEAEQFPSEQKTIRLRVGWGQFRPMKRLAAQERPGVPFGELGIEDAASFVARGLVAASLKNTRMWDGDTGNQILDAQKDGMAPMENAISTFAERIPAGVEAGMPLTLEVTCGSILRLTGIHSLVV